MSAIELRPASGSPARSAAGPLVRNGAELVHLTEALYLQLFRMVMALTLAGCVLSIWFGALADRGAPSALTLVFAGGGIAFAAAGLARPDHLYGWLRYSRWRQLTPAAVAATMVAVNGPDSPSWWVAMPLLWVVADLAPNGLALAAAAVTSLAYLAGTVLGGEALIQSGNAGILAAAVALFVNTAIGRLAAEVFGRFVLRLGRLASAQADVSAKPVPVPNLAGAHSETPAPTHARRRPRRTVGPLGLTARQLEVALLVRDGLRQSEIALCLSISPRQVARLLTDARERTGAASTAHLVAMLVAADLTPPPETEPAAP